MLMPGIGALTGSPPVELYQVLVEEKEIVGTNETSHVERFQNADEWSENLRAKPWCFGRSKGNSLPLATHVRFGAAEATVLALGRMQAQGKAAILEVHQHREIVALDHCGDVLDPFHLKTLFFREFVELAVIRTKTITPVRLCHREHATLEVA